MGGQHLKFEEHFRTVIKGFDSVLSNLRNIKHFTPYKLRK